MMEDRKQKDEELNKLYAMDMDALPDELRAVYIARRKALIEYFINNKAVKYENLAKEMDLSIGTHEFEAQCARRLRGRKQFHRDRNKTEAQR